uniref:Maturase K n=1 Tax=Panagrolaimus superbus TaxID=310955 RepID=A0A914Y619_9BILA
MWPDERVVEQIVGSESRLFIILYKELYYRDLYTRMSLKFLSQHNQSPVNLKLPEIWLWDIIDEFVYQFQAFCLYKANPGKRSAEELEDLVEIENTQNAWNIYPVLNIL